MSARGRFITFEGIDGAGKSSHLDYACELVRARGHDPVKTFEPGGTPFGKKLREVVGAHDCGAAGRRLYPRRPGDRTRAGRALRRARGHCSGARVVEETAVRVATAAGPIWVAGISDLWTGRPDVTATLAAVTDDAPVILMSHNPDVFPEVPARVARG